MDMRRYVSKSDEILNSFARSGKAGASMVEETGEMNVKQETRIVESHFLRLVQLCGLEGSWGPSQVTWPLC